MVKNGVGDGHLSTSAPAPVPPENRGRGRGRGAPVPPALSESSLGWGGWRWSNSECRCFPFRFYWIMYQTPLWSFKKKEKTLPSQRILFSFDSCLHTKPVWGQDIIKAKLWGIEKSDQNLALSFILKVLKNIFFCFSHSGKFVVLCA